MKEYTDPLDLGVGEWVDVYTLAGRFIASGEVASVFPDNGIQVKSRIPNDSPQTSVFQKTTVDFDGDEVDAWDRIYDGTLYKFVVIEPPKPKVKPDSYIDEKQSVQSELEDQDDDSDDDSDDNSDDEKKTKDKDDKSDNTNNIDIDKLPKNLQRKVVGISELGDDEKNSIIKRVGEAALRGFREINLRELDIYKNVAKVQEAVQKVLDDLS